MVVSRTTLKTTHRYNLKMRLFKPRSASLLQSFITWLTGYRAEFADSKFPSYGEGREGEWLLSPSIVAPTPAHTRQLTA